MASVLITSLLVVMIASRQWGRRQRHAAWIALVALAVGLCGLLLRPELAGESFVYKLRATLAGDFFSTRTDTWREALQAIGDHPVTGEDPAAWAPSVPLELARRHGIGAAILALGAIVAASVWAARGGRQGLSGQADGFRSSAPAAEGAFVWAVGWGLAAGLLGFFLVGLAETGLGARVTPQLAAAIAMATLLPALTAPARTALRP
jgi:hypothetical protein